MQSNRRTFLALGASAGAAAMLPGAPGAAADPPNCVPQVCTVPTTQAPAPWSRPKDATTAPRKSASELTPREIERLRAAYAKMRALDKSDPADGRGFQAQRNLHAYYCTTCPGASPPPPTPGPGNPTGDIHQSWRFLPWHRMYLYFHERILGSLVGDMTLRLPYWDWENVAHQIVPPAYAEPNQSLFDATRILTKGQTVQRWLTNKNSTPAGAKRYYQLTLVHYLLDCPFDQFGGTATAGGVVEAGSHGYVHVSAGGDNSRYDTQLPCSGNLAVLNTAGFDPVFYAHHTNLDRLWDSWETSGKNGNPTSSDWLGLKWSFFDADGKWYEMAVSQIASKTQQQLGYTYDKKIPPAMPPSPPKAAITLQQNGRAVPQAFNRAAAASAHSAEVRFTALKVPSAGDFDLSVTSRNKSYRLGSSSFFLVSHGARMAMDATFNVCVPLPPDSVSILLPALQDQHATYSIHTGRTAGSRLFAAAGAAGTPVQAAKIEVILR